MRLKWRRYWPVAAVALGVLIVATVHVAVDRFTREPPNYTRIVDGLWLGGNTTEPPPGTHRGKGQRRAKGTHLIIIAVRHGGRPLPQPAAWANRSLQVQTLHNVLHPSLRAVGPAPRHGSTQGFQFRFGLGLVHRLQPVRRRGGRYSMARIVAPFAPIRKVGLLPFRFIS